MKHMSKNKVPVPVPSIQDSMLVGHSASASCKNAAAKNKNVTFAVAAAIASVGKIGFFPQDRRKYFRSMFACVLTVSITTSFWLFHLHFSGSTESQLYHGKHHPVYPLFQMALETI